MSPIAHDVGDEDHEPDEALDRVGDEVGVGRLLGEGRQEERQEEEEADREAEADDHRHRDRPLAELDVLALGGDRRRAHEHAGADDERLVQDEHPAQERDLDEPPIRRERGRQRLATSCGSRPTGGRTLIATVVRPRIITPSISAWPP